MSREGSFDSGEGGQRPRGPQRKGGRENGFEPLSTKDLKASPNIVAYFMISVKKYKESKVTHS